jgi:ribosomal protein S18 acetylase RimI-like enzyme
MTILVRDLRSEDAKDFHALAVLSHREQAQSGALEADDAAGYVRHLTELHDSGAGCLLVALSDARLAGFVCVLAPEGISSGAAAGAYAFMSDLFVIPEYRRRGIGRQLNAGAEERARELGAERLALRVNAVNATARRFYARFSYQESFVVMSKVLLP